MHIGFVTLESPYDASRGGGIASYLRAIIPPLLELGHRISVFANGEGAAPEEKNLRVYSFKLPGFHSLLNRIPVLGSFLTYPFRQIEWSQKFYSEILKVHQRDPLDVIECSEVGGLFLNRIAPFVVRLHGSEFVFRKYTGRSIDPGLRINHCLDKKIFEKASAITAPSVFHAKEVAESFGWPADKIQAIYNPVAEPVLQEALRHRSERNAQSPVILYAGRLAPVKGVEVLLNAIPLVLKKFPNIQFILTGPWQMPKPPGHWNLNQDQGQVRWLGHIPWRTLMKEWYPKANLFVMPSYYETLGIASLEAMAFGLPVVATKTGGVPEVVEDGITGLLTPPGDAKALAGALNQLLSHPEMCQSMGEAGRKRILEKFASSEIVLKTASLYERVSHA